MAWWRRGGTPRWRFPTDMVARMELFGRREFDHRNSGIDVSDLWEMCVGPFFHEARADPDGFLTALREVMTGAPGGFATYGAAHLTWELFGEKCLTTPTAWPLIDAGIDFIYARGLPTA